ncbi:unnamed protein product [Arctogadus glacialis]
MSVCLSPGSCVDGSQRLIRTLVSVFISLCVDVSALSRPVVVISLCVMVVRPLGPRPGGGYISPRGKSADGVRPLSDPGALSRLLLVRCYLPVCLMVSGPGPVLVGVYLPRVLMGSGGAPVPSPDSLQFEDSENVIELELSIPCNAKTSLGMGLFPCSQPVE